MNAPAQSKSLAGGFTRRGACPALSAPMQTGDGFLVRLNPVAEGLSPNALIGLCNAALAHGNGVVEVTARGSLQIRGLTPHSASALACDVDALGIAVRTGVPVQTSVLAGLDADEIADPTDIAEEIRTGIAAAGLEGRLGPKISVVVDGGGRSALEEVSADVRLTAVEPGIWRMAVAGDAATAKVVANVDERDAAAAAIAILSTIAEKGVAARARDLTTMVVSDVVQGLDRQSCFTPPSVLPDISPTRGEISQSPTPKLLISPRVGEMSGRTEGGVTKRNLNCLGVFPLTNFDHSLGVALPFGHTSAETLAAFAERAKSLGVSDIRLAPKRTILALCPDEAAARALKTVAEDLAFITSPADPRQNISACPGAPACASGHIAARELAAEIADEFRGIAHMALHISGCAKGCAHPGEADITIVGSENGAGIVVAGTARDVPLAYTARDEAKRALVRVAGLLRARAETDGPRTTARLRSEIAGVFKNP